MKIRKLIGKFALPCIHPAMLRSWRNGWVTARRMRSCGNFTQRKCVFGCDGEAQDSIEHYVHCRSIRRAASCIISGTAPPNSIPSGIQESLLMLGCKSKEDIIFQSYLECCDLRRLQRRLA
ncbi:MAG: hypothetical protein ACKPKO_30825, partial [Candidatus Fonsibacter sp.]